MIHHYAAIEAGGTKFNCAVFDPSGSIVSHARFASTVPSETLKMVSDFFIQQQRQGITLASLGIASFGPLDLMPQSKTYGYITKTPKPDWSNTPLLPILTEALNIPAVIDTDVNGAALAEAKLGAGRDDDVVVYVTVGTGVGGGVIVKGEPLHGLIHPEIGHTLVPGHPDLKGTCPFHSNCIEGFASGKAMSQIWGQPAETLADDHPAWELEALVLGQLCQNLLVSFSPSKIVLGGGVMAKQGLLEKVIEKTQLLLNDYLVLPEALVLEDVIVAPGLGENSGLLGAFLLAKKSL